MKEREKCIHDSSWVIEFISWLKSKWWISSDIRPVTSESNLI